MSSPFIPHSRPTLGEDEVRRVSAVIASGHIAQGPAVAEFERAFAAHIGTEDAVAVSSGTAALHLALMALGAGPGTEVIIPSFVCSALLHAVRYVDARPVLADIDPRTFNIDPEDVARRLTGRTCAIVVPHMFGLPAQTQRLLQLKVPIIEDCAQSLGSLSGDRPVGSLGHAGIFSFYATKMITTGEGGMLVSPSAEVRERARELREYDNKTADILRFNYKMTDVQAALGLSQLKRLPAFVRRRREIASRYDLAFKELKPRRPVPSSAHVYYRYVMQVDGDTDALIERMRGFGIGCARPVFRPLHHAVDPGGCPKTQHAWERGLSLPIYPSLQEPEIERIITTFGKVWKS